MLLDRLGTGLGQSNRTGRLSGEWGSYWCGLDNVWTEITKTIQAAGLRRGCWKEWRRRNHGEVSRERNRTRRSAAKHWEEWRLWRSNWRKGSGSSGGLAEIHLKGWNSCSGHQRRWKWVGSGSLSSIDGSLESCKVTLLSEKLHSNTGGSLPFCPPILIPSLDLGVSQI